MRLEEQRVNWYGAYTLSLRETTRFFKVYNQTLISPVVSALIYLAIFTLGVGVSNYEIGGVKYTNFVAYGLIIMSIVQNSFANTSSSLTMSKILGYINDILSPPLTGIEIVIALSIGGIIRGVMVGILVSIALYPFVDYTIYYPWLLIYFTLSAALFLSLVGILTGLVANSFDQSSAFTSYFITPLSFLSGTFYSVSKLPTIFTIINYGNPFFHIINGFRYSLTNYSDGNIQLGIAILFFCNVILLILLVKLINKGWRIRG